MLDFLAFVYYQSFYCLLDFALYILVDIAVKTCLRDARDDLEKRTIWLWEGGVLLGICAVVYVCHHTPWLLCGFAVLTLLYTQLLGRINFRYWWWQLATRWDEFEQHEESMEVYNQSRQQINPPNVSVQPPGQGPPFMMGNRWPAQVMPNMMPQTQMGYAPEQQNVPQFEAWYPADSQQHQQQQQQQQQQAQQNLAPPYSVPMPIVSEAPMMSGGPAQMRYRSPPQQMGQGMPVYAANSPYTPVMPRGSELARKPIHGSPASQTPAKMYGGGGLSSRLKATFMTALGYSKSPGPPGLQNNGQNLCFINSVLQCLAHSPTLVDALVQDSKQDRDTGTQLKALLITTMDILQGLNSSPQTWDPTGSVPLDITQLRHVAAQLPQSLVLDPASDIKQNQQDAAEFLMWLLDALHTSLNTHNRPSNSLQQSFTDMGRHPGNNSGVQPANKPRFATWTLQMLKYIYGDLTPQRIRELKQSCRKEIEQANGLDNDSYAEPIQRLSDLEWLTYKERNCSVIDDLFTGQLVEVQHCTACNRISVGIQTFNILPVPIVGPRQLNGIVFLEDCFTKFGNIEELFGPEGLQCEGCNQSFQQQGIGRSPKGMAGSSPGMMGTPRKHLNMAASLAASPELVNGGSGPIGMNRPKISNRLPSDSALQSMLGSTAASIVSPIPNSGDVFSDSGFQDNQFRTSTPIHSTGAPPLPMKLTDGQRRSLLRQLPECLVVQLLRFTFHQGQPRKVYRPVNIPLVNLDLTGLIIDNVMKREDLTALHACFQYNLYGLALHLGGESTSYGHYVSYAMAADGLWYKFDDQLVTPVNMEYELNTRQVRENAYLLFYRKSVMAP